MCSENISVRESHTPCVSHINQTPCAWHLQGIYASISKHLKELKLTGRWSLESVPWNVPKLTNTSTLKCPLNGYKSICQPESVSDENKTCLQCIHILKKLPPSFFISTSVILYFFINRFFLFQIDLFFESSIF